MLPGDVDAALAWFARQTGEHEPPCDLLLLHDDKLLWPPAHTPQTTEHTGARLDPPERRQLARHVLERLVGLEAARQRVRTACVQEPQPHTMGERSDEALDTLPYMSDVLAGSNTWFGLDYLWPSAAQTPGQGAEPPVSAPPLASSDADTPRTVAEPASERHGKWHEPTRERAVVPRATPTPPSTMAPQKTPKHTPSVAASFSAFHERLSQAIDDTEADKTQEAQLRGAQDMREITQAYAAANKVHRRARVPRIDHEARTAPSGDSARLFPSLLASSAAWYATPQRPAPAQAAATAFNEPADVCVESWRREAPAPWKYARLFVGGEDQAPLTEPSREAPEQIEVVYTTRQLLTVVLVWRGEHTNRDAWLPPAWGLLQRVQRALDGARRRRRSSALQEVPQQYLHLEQASGLVYSTLRASSDARAAPVQAGIEAQLLASEHAMQRLGVKETLSRAENGDFWVAARSSNGAPSHTHLVLRGTKQRHYGIAECDQQMRRLAAQHGTFGL